MNDDSRPLEIGDRKEIDQRFVEANFDTFYHYFPLVYAISESTEQMYLGTGIYRDLMICHDRREIYVPDVRYEVPEKIDLSEGRIRKIWIMPRKPEQKSISFKMYDVNYIYDLKVTPKVKNFRKNVKKFETESSPHYVPSTPQEALEVVTNWFLSRKGGMYSDFGYTMWLAENSSLFKDLRARLIKVGDKPVAFSLWGQLSENQAIHIICKDLGKPRYPYAIDYARYMTYKEMLSDGLLTVNDGSDCGAQGIRIYKQKLRPIQIIPIYSWVSK